jgi:SNF2 family DNA or RNA helicase
MWFRQRYPMKVVPESAMRKRALDYLSRKSKVETIMSAGYVPQDIKFADGLAPRTDQRVAAELIRATGQVLLADDLGLGKTVSGLAAIADPALRPALVVLPPHLGIQWQRQAKKFLPKLRTHILTSTTPYALDLIVMCPGCGLEVERSVAQRCPKCRIKLTKAKGKIPDLIMCSYSKLKGWSGVLPSICKSVIFDEGHSLRRSDSEKWKAATAISSQIPYRCLMSATPLYNLGGEAWNVLEVVAPGFLGPKDLFRKEWCGYAGANGREPPLNDPDAFGAYLRSSRIMLRRTNADIGRKVGECIRIVQPIEANEEVFNKATDRAGELARILLSNNPLKQGDAMRAAGEFDSLLRQATGLAKASYVAAFVEMLIEQGLPTVLFAWHHAVYDVYAEKLEKYQPVFYTGSQTGAQKDAAVSRFLSGDTDLFVCSLRSGEGLDGLQRRSSTAVIGELDWSHSAIQQCIGRLDRDGQQNPVTVYLPLSDYGLDPSMAEVLDLKRNQLEGVLGARAVGPTKKIDTQGVLRGLASKYLRRA